VSWLEKRLPLREFIESQLTHYYAPKNFNVWYYFGVLALVVLVSQFATGIVLAMFYKPGEATAFDSVEYIMREVPWGWLIRRGPGIAAQGVDHPGLACCPSQRHQPGTDVQPETL